MAEELIPANEVAKHIFKIHSSILNQLYSVLNVESGNREELFKTLEKHMGNLLWTPFEDGCFLHQRTKTKYVLDDLGFKYVGGLNSEEIERAVKHEASTITLDNGLEFLKDYRQNGIHLYLLNDFSDVEKGFVRYERSKSLEERLIKAAHLANNGIQLKASGTRTRVSVDEHVETSGSYRGTIVKLNEQNN